MHTCTWCCEPIESGTLYDLWASVDASYFVNKMHPECHSAMTEYIKDTPDNSYIPYENLRGKAYD